MVPRHGQDAAGGAVGVDLGVAGDEHDAHQGRTEAAEGQQHLGDVAGRAGRERLDDHAEAGDAEDDEQRPELEVLDLSA